MSIEEQERITGSRLRALREKEREWEKTRERVLAMQEAL